MLSVLHGRKDGCVVADKSRFSTIRNSRRPGRDATTKLHTGCTINVNLLERLNVSEIVLQQLWSTKERAALQANCNCSRTVHIR